MAKKYTYHEALHLLAGNDQKILTEIKKLLKEYARIERYDGDETTTIYDDGCSQLFKLFKTLAKNIKRGVISEVIKGTEYTSYKVWKYDMKPDSPRACLLNFFLTAMVSESGDDIRKRAENGEDWLALRHELLY